MRYRAGILGGGFAVEEPNGWDPPACKSLLQDRAR